MWVEKVSSINFLSFSQNLGSSNSLLKERLEQNVNSYGWRNNKHQQFHTTKCKYDIEETPTADNQQVCLLFKAEPEGPNVHAAIVRFENILYMDREN